MAPIVFGVFSSLFLSRASDFREALEPSILPAHKPAAPYKIHRTVRTGDTDSLVRWIPKPWIIRGNAQE
jgi:hypothetical protein